MNRAREIYVQLEDDVSEVSLLNPIGFTWLAHGDLERTRRVCEEGIRRASELGLNAAEAGFWTTLGEVERYDGNWSKARRCYARAERLDKICGTRHVYLVRFNSVLVEIGAENYSLAREELRALEPALERVGLHGWLSGTIDLIYACCDAADARWASALTHVQRAIEIIRDQQVVERDVATVAETVGALAARADRDELAELTLELAREQRRALD